MSIADRNSWQLFFLSGQKKQALNYDPRSTSPGGPLNIICACTYIQSTEVLAIHVAIISQQHVRAPSPSTSEKRLTSNPGGMARHAHFAVLSRKLNSSGRDISEVRRGPPRRYISIRRRGIKNSQRKFLTSPAGLPRFSLSREMYRRCYSGEKKKARRLFTSPRRIYEPSAGGIPRLTSPTSPKKINSCWETRNEACNVQCRNKH